MSLCNTTKIVQKSNCTVSSVFFSQGHFICNICNTINEKCCITVGWLIVLLVIRLICLCCSARRIGDSLSAARTFFELFDRTSTIDNGSTKGEELVKQPLQQSVLLISISTLQINFHGRIEFDQVKFIYPSRPTSVVLNKFQLAIEPGKGNSD